MMKQFIRDVFKNTLTLILSNKAILLIYASVSVVLALIAKIVFEALTGGSFSGISAILLIGIVSLILAYCTSTFLRIVFHCILSQAHGQKVTRLSLVKQVMPLNVLRYLITRIIVGSPQVILLGMLSGLVHLKQYLIYLLPCVVVLSALALLLASRLIVSEAALVDTESTPKHAIAKSWNITRGYPFASFVYLLVYIFFANVPTLAKATQFGPSFLQAYSYTIVLIGYAIYVLFTSLEPAAQVAMYLRAKH